MMGQSRAPDVKDYPDSTNIDDAGLFKHHHKIRVEMSELRGVKVQVEKLWSGLNNSVSP